MDLWVCSVDSFQLFGIAQNSCSNVTNLFSSWTQLKNCLMILDTSGSKSWQLTAAGLFGQKKWPFVGWACKVMKPFLSTSNSAKSAATWPTEPCRWDRRPKKKTPSRLWRRWIWRGSQTHPWALVPPGKAYCTILGLYIKKNGQQRAFLSTRSKFNVNLPGLGDIQILHPARMHATIESFQSSAEFLPPGCQLAGKSVPTFLDHELQYKTYEQYHQASSMSSKFLNLQSWIETNINS